ncbi:hypothetical protein [Mesorhizobium sp. M8A.F.Ca.ET.021.01.1.1]|uniref:hypothetical protein n=1 Tax=Mesorhizobium sp. M8A.F.Ca.ET.021.01.1.1 TaxID=2496757 RepID=UPI000FCA57E4|nr:hypothetical protein [Mesorhizobium sp. M8A.F.Ca.ET.021.01.1.1]RUW56842.1 hypothetical protein EOA36_02260 [Mesorhizobium sp. M8A.F.Ca.ET.021.01.1.1]
MQKYDKIAIAAYASGIDSFITSALLGFRRSLEAGEPIEGPYMLFMSEVDSPVPDLALRAKYRQMVIEAEKADGK